MEFQYVDRQMSTHLYKFECIYILMHPPPQAIRKKHVFDHFRQGGGFHAPPPNTQTETYIANKRKHKSHNDH